MHRPLTGWWLFSSPQRGGFIWQRAQSKCGRDEAPLVHDVPDGLPSRLLVVGELLGLAVGQKPSGIVARVEHRAARLGVAPLDHPLRFVGRRVDELPDLPFAARRFARAAFDEVMGLLVAIERTEAIALRQPESLNGNQRIAMP